MASISANLEMVLPDTFDKVDVEVLTDNFTKIDTALGEMVTKEIIANNLETEEEGKILDARQGKALADQIKTISDESLSIEDVILNLDSLLEDDTTSVVSAAVVYALKKMIESINCGTARTVMLPASAWSGTNNAYTATIEVEGVMPDSVLDISPVPASHVAYINATVRATAQGEGTLTFTAATKPTTDMNVNVANFHLEVVE